MLAAARRLPLAEVLPAIGLFVVAALAVGPQPVLLGFGWLALVTPYLVAIDVAEHRLPDVVVLPGYPVVLAAVMLSRRWSSPRSPAVSSSCCSTRSAGWGSAT